MKWVLAMLVLKFVILAAVIHGGNCAHINPTGEQNSSTPTTENATANLSVLDKLADVALRLFLEGADEVEFPIRKVNILLFKVEKLTVIGLPSLYRACPINLTETLEADTGAPQFILSGCIGATNLSFSLRIKNILGLSYDLRFAVNPFVAKFNLELLPERTTEGASLDNDVIPPRHLVTMLNCELTKWDGVVATEAPFKFVVRGIVRALTPKELLEVECEKFFNGDVMPKFLLPKLGKIKNRNNRRRYKNE